MNYQSKLEEIIKPFETKELIREQEMIERGQERYTKRLQQQTSDSSKDVEHSLITDAITKVSEGISDDIKFEDAKLKGRKHPWLQTLKLVDPDTLAYIGLNACMDAVGKYSTRQKILDNIGHRVELEVWAEGLKKFSKLAKEEKKEKYDLFTYVNNRVTKAHKIEKWRELSSRTIAAKRGYFVEPWSLEFRQKVGAPIYNAVLEKSKIFEPYKSETLDKKTNYKLKTKWKVGLTKEAQQIITEQHFDASWATPMHSPMTTPPKSWDSFDTGCYLDPALAASVPLVRGSSRLQRRQIDFALSKTEQPEFLKALNIIQSTPLKINTFVLEAVQWTFRENKSFGKFPRKDMLEVPEKPEDFEDMDWKDKRRFLDDRREIQERNNEIGGSNTVMSQDIQTAVELSKYKEFYSPMNMDTRGRMYHVSNFNYTRADHIKAMFNMAIGSTVTTANRGVTLLLIAIANNWDCSVDGVKLTKMSFDDRADYVFSQIDMLLNVVENYTDHFEFWSKADKPFQFLAALDALNQYLINPEELCHLPFSIDGSVSGIQHYSAMSLNSEDARKVNLLPADVPQDLYGIVADATLKKLHSDKLSKDQTKGLASLGKTIGDVVQLWLKYGVGRKECKRNTMCWTYSSKVFGLTDQLMQDFMVPLTRSLRHGDISQHPFGCTSCQREACMYLAKVNYESIGDTVKSAGNGMNFIQNCAALLAHENKDLLFVTPASFPMVQKYTHYDQKKLKLFLYDRVAKIRTRGQVTINKTGFKVDKKKARAAAAPNIIHSLDSAHLQKTVLKCVTKDPSCSSFFMIHDSFGTNLDGASNMFSSVREAFVEMYSNTCMYENLMRQCSDRMSKPSLELFGEIPPKGDLDLNLVRESNYCFA